MAKKSINEIRKELRKDMTKSFELKYGYLQDDLERYKKSYNESNERFKSYYKKYNEVKSENEELREKIRGYEEWVNRLMEFMDISDDDKRREAFKVYIEGQRNSNSLKGLLDSYSRLFRFL